MSSFRIVVVAVFAYLLGFFSQNAFASDNGVFKLELPDAAAAGMGGAFAGEADRPSAVYYNPAGIVQMNTAEVSAGLTWAQPQIKFESATSGNGGTSEMKEDNYLFPDFFVTTPVIKDKLYIGVGEDSDFGGGNSWEANSPFTEYSTIKDSIEDQDTRLALAYKFNSQLSLGAGVTNDQSEFEHDEAINQGGAPTGNGNVLFKANDNSWGFDLATMFRLNEQNQFGLDYKSPIHHTYDGTAYFSNLYTGGGLGNILGGSSISTEAVQKLTLPHSVTLGYSLKPTNKWPINFDLEWTDWSQYQQQTTYYPNLSSFQTSFLPGPQARNWTSVWSESVGVQYAVTDKLRLRTGYEHHQTPVPELTFNTEFPDSDSNAVSFGLGYDITSRLTIDMAYIADFYESRNVINTIDQSLGASLSGKYSAFVNVATMSLTYKF
jgi:long-chain fatty acid transport protein